MDRPQNVDPTALQVGVASLADLRLTPAGLDHLLVQVASLAVEVVPGADGAGLTLFRPGRTYLVVATDPFVTRVDTVQ